MRFWPAVATATKLRAIVVRPGVEPARHAQLAPDPAQPPAAVPVTPITPTVTPEIRAAAHEDGRRFERTRIEAGLAQLNQRRRTIEAAHELVTSRIRFLGHVVQRADALQTAHIARHAPDLLRPPDPAADSADTTYVPAAPLGNKKSAAKQRASAKAAAQQKNKSRAQAEAAKARVGAGAPCAFDVRLAWDDRDWQAFVASDAGGRTLEQGLPELTAAPRPDAEGEDADAEADEAPIEDPDGFVCLQTRKRCDRHSGWDRLIEAGFAAERTAHVRALRGRGCALTNVRRRLSSRSSRRRSARCGDGSRIWPRRRRPRRRRRPSAARARCIRRAALDRCGDANRLASAGDAIKLALRCLSLSVHSRVDLLRSDRARANRRARALVPAPLVPLSRLRACGA